MGKIRRLTSTEWLEARQAWEADPTLTFEALATRYGISRPAVSKMAGKQGWVKSGSLNSINRAAQLRADSVEVTSEVSSVTAKKPLPESVDQSTELRSRLIQSHRNEWRRHASLYSLEVMKDSDFELSKKAKISSEMLAIRQKAERTAWGMDDDKTTDKTILIERSYG